MKLITDAEKHIAELRDSLNSPNQSAYVIIAYVSGVEFRETKVVGSFLAESTLISNEMAANSQQLALEAFSLLLRGKPNIVAYSSNMQGLGKNFETLFGAKVIIAVGGVDTITALQYIDFLSKRLHKKHILFKGEN